MAKITTKVDARTSDPDFIPRSPATEETLARLIDLLVAVKQNTGYLIRPPYMEQATGRLRAHVETGAITTVTNLTNLGTGNVSGMYIDRMSWANNVRNMIT